MNDPHDLDSAIGGDEGRVRHEYARRSGDERMRRYYERIRPALRRAHAERRTLVLAELDRLGDRARLRVLDVGCGFGDDLEFLRDAGVGESNLAGVDLVDERIAEARDRLPGADLRIGNGAALPFEDETFDAALQSAALSSVVDAAVRARIAAEMLRVTRRGGLVVSYDMAVVGGRNPHLVRIDRGELVRLFGERRLERVTRLTLLLPIASRAPSWFRGLAARVPQLRSHLLAVIRRDQD